MIAGTVVIEDHSIQFHLDEDGAMVFTVCDSLTGVTYSRTVQPHKFVHALALALHPSPDEMPGSVEMYPDAEDIMPKDNLPFGTDDQCAARQRGVQELAALRWIP